MRRDKGYEVLDIQLCLDTFGPDWPSFGSIQPRIVPFSPVWPHLTQFDLFDPVLPCLTPFDRI